MSGKDHLFDNRRNIQRVLWVLVVICGLVFAADFIFHRHIVHPWEELWGFYAIYGFVACVVLVLVAKQMRKLLMRGEDYYDRDD